MHHPQMAPDHCSLRQTRSICFLWNASPAPFANRTIPSRPLASAAFAGWIGLLIFLCAATFPADQAQAQAGRAGKVEIVKISPSFVATPEYEFQGDRKRTPARPGKWLEVEVEFSSGAEFREELTFTYYILFNKKLLVGEVTHINIPSGKSLFSVMYVSPRSIERIMEGKTVTANSIENIGIEVTSQGRLEASKSFNERMRGEWWKTFQQMRGMVVTKNETPFAPLYWDRYEAIRVGTR
jgi:hypothetical protein